MGSCVSSSHNKTSSTSPSVVNLAALISKPDVTSPVKNDVITPITINGNSILHSGPLDSSGYKEEMVFFDSRGWLDSDCEDDFMSVDGEFTPSRGTTPVHHNFCDQIPKAEETKHEEEEEALPSPTDNKKRLLELFKETQDEDEEEEQEVDVVAKSKARACLWLRTPVRSSAPTTPYNNDRERQRLKRVRSATHGGCVPRLVSCSSFTERRRKMMSHVPIDVQR
ncbi:hypothetical protein AALP_AA3G010000 [Arabis alpina]|uniref:Uncharacterized protein n=1 Tax=Arabis alpina TaxID=50452 RepID=A0A087H692_ARAAL|nr:hypothetical protein AALP_AA3G010000 [Arabis alpina]